MTKGTKMKEISQAKFNQAAKLFDEIEQAKIYLKNSADLAHKRMWKMNIADLIAKRRQILDVAELNDQQSRDQND
jgi:hypothetical protein